MTMSRPPTTDLGAVAEAIRAHDRFLLVTHENPDGDALGSILGAKLALDRLAKESVMYLGDDTAPPTEYGFLALDELLPQLPGASSDRALVYDGGRVVISYLLRGDFNELGVGEEYAEGIIDYLRAVEGAELAATIREPPEPPDAQRRISMRASSDEVDVSAIARQRGG